jgi:hypothetical protein
VLSGRVGDVVQMGEGERGSDDGLDQDSVNTGQMSAHARNLLSDRGMTGYGRGAVRELVDVSQ